jgi:hypothetical protein
MENVPNEIKNSAELQLSRHYCSFIEHMSYTELLTSVLNSLRAKWNSTNSSINSTVSNDLRNNVSMPDFKTRNENDYEYNQSNVSRQSINIQFKR